MAADPTLVKASLIEAKTRAGAMVPDLSPLYKSTVDIAQQHIKGIMGVFSEMKKRKDKQDKGRETQLNGFKTELEAARKHIFDAKQPLPMKVHDAIYDRFKELQAEFELYNTYGDEDSDENEKARAMLSAKLAKIKNQAIEARAQLMIIANAKDKINIHATEANDIAIATEIFKVNTNYDNVTMSFDKDDNLVWNVTLSNYWRDATSSWDEKQSWTIEDLKKRITIENLSIDTYELEKQKELRNEGKNTKISWDDEKQAENEHDFIKNVLQGDNSIVADAATRKINGGISFKEALLESIDISEIAVSHLFTEDAQIGFLFEDLDRDGDKKIEKEDLIKEIDGRTLNEDQKRLWMLNHETIVNVLTNPSYMNGKYFNYNTTSDLMAKFFVSRRKGAFEDGKKNRQIDNSTKYGLDLNTWYPTYGGKSQLGSSIRNRYDSFIDGDEFESYDNKFKFSKENDKWYIDGPTDPKGDGSYSGPNEIREISERDLADLMGFTENAKRLGYKIPKRTFTDAQIEDQKEQEKIRAYQESLIGTDLSYKIFSKTSESQYDALNKFGQEKEIMFSKITKTGFFRGETTQNKIEVSTMAGDDDAPKIILDFSVEDEKKQKRQMQKLNEFIEKYSNAEEWTPDEE